MTKAKFKPPFAANMFTGTEWDTAQDIAKRLNALARFVVEGMPQNQWTNNGLYHTLYQHMYGHIAHYNMHGFWDEWFSTPERRMDWIRYALHHGSYGRPMNLEGWLGAQDVFTDWLRNNPEIVEQYSKACITSEVDRAKSVGKAALSMLTPTEREELLQELRES